MAEGEAYNKSKSTVIDGKQKTVPAVASKDFTIIERIANQAEHKVEFSTNEKGFQAPLKKNTELGTLTYTDPNRSAKAIWKQSTFCHNGGRSRGGKKHFLQVWWNDFVRYVNEKL